MTTIILAYVLKLETMIIMNSYVMCRYKVCVYTGIEVQVDISYKHEQAVPELIAMKVRVDFLLQMSSFCPYCVWDKMSTVYLHSVRAKSWLPAPLYHCFRLMTII